MTLVVVLPGHQTLSYNPIVEDLTLLIISLEKLIYRHHSRREIASVSSEAFGSVSQSSLLDATAHYHRHGHQHDLLHDQVRRRSVGNTDHAALTTGAAASVAVAILAGTNTHATTTGDRQATAVVVGMTGAASLSDRPTVQSAGPNVNPPPLANDQDPHPSLEGANSKAAGTGSPHAGHSVLSQVAPASSGASATSTTAANPGTQSILQRQFSTAERVSPFGMSHLRLCAMVCSLWVFSVIVLPQWRFPLGG